ncbi:antibiotic biosynthesis monooxygenase [Acuticoccus sp. M5D2P5]|uniref:antibiotic biosynthesis monooxygenase family protein n=1 Tax=Acuticoccus kalidii TaxID=2910977 RepID=UPI001F2271A3|nr:antibiotic biosynthesis monooxygenase [Acuticoccus kalidii]
MFIAMNRFRVNKGSEQEFENVWLNRDSQLKNEKGFVEFQLLRGPEQDDVRLYVSHTVWASEEDFIAWTKGPAFAEAHRNARTRNKLYSGGPHFEGFNVLQTVTV